MSTSVVTRTMDSHGNTLRFGDMGDYLIPPFAAIQDFRQHANDVKEMTMNPDDVIIVNYPKTGNHWLAAILHMLKEGSTDSYFKKFQADTGVLLDMTPTTSEDIEPADRQCFFFTHFKFHHLPTQAREKRVKLIYLQRNPKDTWVSFYNHSRHIGIDTDYKGSWDEYFDIMMSSGVWYGNWFDFVLDWERDLDKVREAGMPVMVNSYEDMKKDPLVHIQKLDQFLGYNRGRELCEQIAQASQFSTMKSVMEQACTGSKSVQLAFYRKGEVGDWKNWFTVAQNEQFDRMYRDRMQGSKLRYTFE